MGKKLSGGGKESPLGSKASAGKVSGNFRGGAGAAEPRLGKKTSRFGKSKNSANSGVDSRGKKPVALSKKDGSRSGGSPATSGSSKGPRGRRSKNKRVSGGGK